ncbi:MFS transporter, DHA2 family, multidrug resistance protein [Collimonas sp. OK242]|uniref:DHA2 family efflux MFS transporter permease subunit n=1 Tax=Collimonas sp. OK242 TaxID=1798195 RepID=UPI0008970F81|nr:DHA2 family efflux MFS transporter permease subunit [Collimonas sp. OK242]SDY85395.1 MFS transporter, DHA2 family, multidrug resistance protein [Collimonas sp. OK242]
MTQAQAARNAAPALQGTMLWVGAIVLALANFLAVLNMTIANVTQPNMAGALGAGSSQGTWIITAYAVAEAISVPLTGWLSSRFGAIKVFSLSVLLFGIFSLMCGVSTSIGMLLLMRVFQGFAGGPLLALSQTLLLRIFPKEKSMQAMGLWAMTTLLAPVVGPVLGGWICDNYSWPWVYFINIPMALAFSVISWKLLKRYEEPVVKNPVDKIGFMLLFIWVASLQIMLDEGKDKDWFSSPEICVLGVIAAIGFVSFVIWELTESHPIVDLRVFRHRGFSTSMFVLALAFGGFFGLNVLTPLWLQNNMGYNTTWAGLVVMWGGVLSVVFSPIAANLSNRVDARWLIFFGCAWLGCDTAWRALANPQMDFWTICIPLLVMGVGMPMYYVPITGLAMGSVDEKETASAAGLMNFVRTISGAFATSLVTTSWQDRSYIAHDQLASIVDPAGKLAAQIAGAPAMAGQAAREMFNNMVTGQSLMLATNGLMMATAVVFFIAAFAITLAPKAARAVDAASIGH